MSDFETLSRIQFGLTIGFHYLFSISTLGVAFYILVFETLHWRKGDEEHKRIADFLVKLLTLIFTFGVATGIMMPFAFGANWARFSAFAGPVFGVQLAIEGTTAFALEAVFLGLLIFGRGKVSKGLYWTSALMVFLGSHLSAFWIISANSWMQSPAGYAIENGRVVLTSLFDAIFNPTALVRFMHVTVAAWITGSAITLAVASYYILKDRHAELFKKALKTALPPFIALTLLQAGVGHMHIMHLDPLKEAAYEGVFKTTKGATLYAFGIPDAKNERIILGAGMPYMLSFLSSGSFTHEVPGLDKAPKEDWPPVNVVFTTFHIMVLCGGIMAALAILGGFLLWKGRLFETRWYLAALIAALPLPYVANELGWIGTEMSRQPWTIYKVLRTVDSTTTTVPDGQVAISLALVCCVYATLAALFVRAFSSALKKGPQAPESKEA